MQEQEHRNQVTLELIDRQMMRLNGVNNVDVFDEEKIVLQTELGKLEIKGQQLNVTSLDVEDGNLQVDGMKAGVETPCPVYDGNLQQAQYGSPHEEEGGEVCFFLSSARHPDGNSCQKDKGRRTEMCQNTKQPYAERSC